MVDEIKSNVAPGSVTDSPTAPKRPRGRPRKAASASVADNKFSKIGASTIASGTRVQGSLKTTPMPVASAVSAEVVHAKKSLRVVTPLDYIFVVGRRKRAVARVFIYKTGAGDIEINEQAMEKFFPAPVLQEIVRAALTQSPFKDSVRIVAKVRGGGVYGQAIAVQLGIARGLLKLDETLRPTFRARGYLTRDPREKERKKAGLKRARRAPQWQKR